MVFAAFLSRDAHMRAALTHLLVTHLAERRQKGGAAHIARELHATRISSLT